MSQFKPTKQFTVDDKPIFVFDDLLEKKVIDELTMALSGAAFTHTEIARPDVEAYRHWAFNMPLEVAINIPIVNMAMDIYLIINRVRAEFSSLILLILRMALVLMNFIISTMFILLTLMAQQKMSIVYLLLVMVKNFVQLYRKEMYLGFSFTQKNPEIMVWRY